MQHGYKHGDFRSEKGLSDPGYRDGTGRKAGRRNQSFQREANPGACHTADHKGIEVQGSGSTSRQHAYRGLLPLPELVEHCEALNFDQKVMKDYFTKQFESFDMNEYGTIVLGCTHYPFYKSILSDLCRITFA